MPSQVARRAPVGRLERVVEPPQAAEARGQRDLRHAQVRLVEQALREVQAARLRDHDRRRPDVLHEQAMEVAGADPDARGERFDGRLVERAFVDQLQRAAHDRGRAEPGRRARRRFGRQRRHGR
jgi:hypothetical protein